MKTATIIHLAIGVFIIPLLASFLALPPLQAEAQDSGYPEPSGKYSREELAQMLAPVALYPDALLSQVLMASTYPIEVIEADRWIKKNPDLKGEALDSVLLDEDWDPSVKALCHFPPVLAQMSERIAETTTIGNAFLAQEDEVMDMVQELRARAYAQGNLTTTSEQKVIVEKETIIIEPADSRVIFVPYYDPFSIYGPWWYPDYPPYYWGPARVGIGFGISYWPGFHLEFAFFDWSYFDWHNHYIYINVLRRPRYVRHDRWRPKPGRWYHVPGHRRGVAYRDKSTARKYGQYPSVIRESRHDARGFPGRRSPDRSVKVPTGIDRGTRGDGRTRIDRDRRERERIERERADRARLERTKMEREHQERQRVERERQERTKIERERQVRQKADRGRQAQRRVERQQQERSRDNVFNRVEEGRMERESSRRGRSSRLRTEKDVSRGGRGDRGRNRR